MAGTACFDGLVIFIFHRSEIDFNVVRLGNGQILESPQRLIWSFGL